MWNQYLPAEALIAPLSSITQFLLVNDYAAWRNHIWLTYAPGPSQVQAYKSYKIKREKKKGISM